MKKTMDNSFFLFCHIFSEKFFYMTINLYVYSPFVFLISCLGCKKIYK